MKVLTGKFEPILECLYRGLFKVRENLFELKATVTNANPPYNIAIGFTDDELETFVEDVVREKKDIVESNRAMAKIINRLLEIITEFPKYPDDVGGMYPIEIQIYTADVDKTIEKLKETLEKVEQ